MVNTKTSKLAKKIKAKTKIAFFHNEDLRSRNLSSIGLYIRKVCLENKKTRMLDISILGPEGLNATKDSLAEGFHIYKPGIGKLPSITFRILVGILKNRKLLRNFDALWFQQVNYALGAVLVGHKNIIVTIHGRETCHEVAYGKNLFKIYITKLIEKIIIAKSKKIILINRGDLEYYHKKFPTYRRKFIMISTFFDEKIFRLNKDAVNKKIKIFIYTGRLVSLKKIDSSLDIFNAYLKKSPRSIFYIIGEGREKPALIKKIRLLKISKNVKFIPWIANSSLSKYYQAADLFITSSTTEGFSISCLESLACGTPVLAQKSAGSVEMIKPGLNGDIFDLHTETTEKIINKIDMIFANRKIYASSSRSVKKYQSSAICPIIISALNTNK